MASLYKRGKIWYIDYALHRRRIKRRIGKSKSIAELALAEVERKISLANARQLLYSIYEDESEACQICGYNLIVERHHFIPRSQGGSNSPANKVTLCPNHHRLLHLALNVLHNEKSKNAKKVKE